MVKYYWIYYLYSELKAQYTPLDSLLSAAPQANCLVEYIVYIRVWDIHNVQWVIGSISNVKYSQEAQSFRIRSQPLLVPITMVAGFPFLHYWDSWWVQELVSHRDDGYSKYVRLLFLSFIHNYSQLCNIEKITKNLTYLHFILYEQSNRTPRCS